LARFVGARFPLLRERARRTVIDRTSRASVRASFAKDLADPRAARYPQPAQEVALSSQYWVCSSVHPGTAKRAGALTDWLGRTMTSWRRCKRAVRGVERCTVAAFAEACQCPKGVVASQGIVAPLLCSMAQISGRAPLTLLELVGWRRVRVRSLPAIILGGTLATTTLIAAETAVGLVFDPRWRDFPFASLTMAVVPFST
jgi:hypothetical protein